MPRLRNRLLAGMTALLITVTPAKADVFDDILDALTEYADDIGAHALGGVWTDVMRWLGPYLQYYQQVRRLFPSNPDWVTPGDVKWRVDEAYDAAMDQAKGALEKGMDVMTRSAASSMRNDALKVANVSPVSPFAAIQIGNAIAAENVDAINLQNNQLSELLRVEADKKLTQEFQSKQAHEYIVYHYRSHNGDTQIFGNGTLPTNVRTFDVGW